MLMRLTSGGSTTVGSRPASSPAAILAAITPVMCPTAPCMFSIVISSPAVSRRSATCRHMVLEKTKKRVPLALPFIRTVATT